MASASPPVDLSHHFSYTTKQRAPSAVKDFYKYFLIPDIANLAGGLPNASYFPYDTLEASAAHPQRFPLAPDGKKSQGPQPSERVIVPKESPSAIQKKIDITTALQYGTIAGIPPLATFVNQFVREHLHPNVPYAGGPDTVLSVGATDGFSRVVEAFTNTWNPDRDWVHLRQGVICEEFVYMNAIQTFQPRGLNIAPVAMDAEGMLPHGPGGLLDVLQNWDYRNGRRPHVMYTITIGQNPTGGTLSVERRKQIYAICQKFDVIIVEDDPYWNLQYPSAQEMQAKYRNTSIGATQLLKRNYNAGGKSSGYEFLDSLVPSYLSIDTDGRVVRLDTFSKTIAPGCRLGWVTAQPAVIERIARIGETSTQQPSGFVQAMVAELILGQQVDDDSVGSRKDKKEKKRGWQMDGWVRWLEGLRARYERRMQQMCIQLEEGKYTTTDAKGNTNESSLSSDEESSWEIVDKVQMYDFLWPTGGMFVWIKVNYESHPLRREYEPERLAKALWVHMTHKPYRCLLGPGGMFAPTPEVQRRAWQYLRICFAAMPEDDVVPVSERLVEGFRAFWQRKNLDGLEDGDDGDDDDEIEAINAIYDPHTITISNTSSSTSSSTIDLGDPSPSPSPTTAIKLQIPNHPHLSFLLAFETTYPDTPPRILGTASTAWRGEGRIAIDVLEDILGRTYQPGAVCLFDVINEAIEIFEELSIGGANTDGAATTTTTTKTKATTTEETQVDNTGLDTKIASLSLHETFGLDQPPDWVMSEVVTEKKSVFVGRAAHVTSLDQAQAYLDYLLASDKKVASATHNISAWRIRQKQKPPSSSRDTSSGKGGSSTAPGEMIIQDCDDDGETAAGGRLLHLMQLMDVWDVVVVVTRWYGGVLLGPDRFRIINAVGRDALVKGGFGKEKEGGGEKEKGKKKGKK
ncbi:putative aromatic amino acid aminotransferase [Aspergillus lucknowensis]|uniref:Pyridoxal phosphate-dependent transferase n=1 Tax=Aspergillus lucknowensis TaxID=176173 RepID=A0ABR4LDX0_9EURO